MKRHLFCFLIVLSVTYGLYGQDSSDPEMAISSIEDELRGDRSPHVNGTFYTQYYGVRNGNISYLLWAVGDTCFYLLDTDAAVGVFQMGQVSDTPPNVLNSFCNESTTWGNTPNVIYENYILDAYWAATKYSYYLQI